MINDDILIKLARKRGYKDNWPQEVRYMRNRIYDIKLGFPGIRNDHMDLLEYSDLKEGDYFIYDPYIEIGADSGIDAPKLFKILGDGKYIIEGIGCGLDLQDPDRNKYRYKDVVQGSDFCIPGSHLCLRVNVRPDLCGGPGYYYFFKSYRDFRM